MTCKALRSPPTPQAAEHDHKIELADIFRLHGPAYLARFGDRILPSHRRAMEDIVHCRTEYFGGKVYFCKDCDEVHYSYHSCKNRFCPKCGHHQIQEWLDRAQDLLGAKSPPAPTPKAPPETPPTPDVPDEPGGMKSELIRPPQADLTVLPSYFEAKTLPPPSQEPPQQKPSISTPTKPLQPGGFLPHPDEPVAANPKPINCPKCGKPMQWMNDVLPNKTTHLFRARSP